MARFDDAINLVNHLGSTVSDAGGYSFLTDAANVRYEPEKCSVEEAIKKMSAVEAYVYKGTVSEFADLPTTGVTNGDVYNVEKEYLSYPAGTNFAAIVDKNGNITWDGLGGMVSVPVDDVKVNGTSVVTSKVANINVPITSIKYGDSELPINNHQVVVPLPDIPPAPNVPIKSITVNSGSKIEPVDGNVDLDVITGIKVNQDLQTPSKGIISLSYPLDILNGENTEIGDRKSTSLVIGSHSDKKAICEDPSLKVRTIPTDQKETVLKSPSLYPSMKVMTEYVAANGKIYQPGDNITIENDTISAVDTTYTGDGTTVEINDGVISALNNGDELVERKVKEINNENKTSTINYPSNAAVNKFVIDEKLNAITQYCGVDAPYDGGKDFYVPIKIFAPSDATNPTSTTPGLYALQNHNVICRKNNIVDGDMVRKRTDGKSFVWEDENTKDSKNNKSSSAVKYTGTFYLNNPPAFFDMFQVMIQHQTNGNIFEAHIIKYVNGNNDIATPVLFRSKEGERNQYVLCLKFHSPTADELTAYNNKWGVNYAYQSTSAQLWGCYVCTLAESLDSGKFNNIININGHSYVKGTSSVETQTSTTPFIFDTKYWEICPIKDLNIKDVQTTSGKSVVNWTNGVATIPDYVAGDDIKIEGNKISLISHQRVLGRNLVYSNPWPNGSGVGPYSLYNYEVECELNGVKLNIANLDDLPASTKCDYNETTTCKVNFTGENIENRYIPFFHLNSVVGFCQFKIKVNDTRLNRSETHYANSSVRTSGWSSSKQKMDNTGSFAVQSSLNWRWRTFFGEDCSGSNYSSSGKIHFNNADWTVFSSPGQKQYAMDLFLEVPKDFEGSVEWEIIKFQSQGNYVDGHNKFIVPTKYTEYTTTSVLPSALMWKKGQTQHKEQVIDLWSNEQISKYCKWELTGQKNSNGDEFGYYPVDLLAELGEDLKTKTYNDPANPVYISDTIINDFLIHYLQKQINNISVVNYTADETTITLNGNTFSAIELTKDEMNAILKEVKFPEIE